MCDVNPDYTTLTGPEGELRRLVENWEEVIGPLGRLDLPRPHLHSLRESQLGSQFDSEWCPAVAVIWHRGRLGHRLADALQVRLLVTSATSEDHRGQAVICEPGFRLSVATWTQPWPAAAVNLSPDSVARAYAAIGGGTGHSVAVLDTGESDLGAAQMIDFVGGNPTFVAAEDKNGHGSAVSALVRALRPHASVTSVRVANERGLAESRDILLGLTFALWSGRYDVLNVSLTSQLAGNCATTLGRSLAFVLEMSRRRGPDPEPVLVAAAGNRTSGQSLGYPALLPNALVATALDWNGQPADYSLSTSGTQVIEVPAFGGTAIDPFGTVIASGDEKPLYGTSFAAAVVTASQLH